MTSFGERLRSAVTRYGQLCVGIDPHEHLLADWNLDATPAGVREFGLRVVDAAAGRVAVVKPQVSFFERFGSAGFAALEDVLAAARAAGLLVIADAKRGDIGTTMDAYAAAWLLPGSPLEADALTVNPYLGVGALDGAMALSHEHGKGLFVLAATSNPDAPSLQTARTADPESRTVSSAVIGQISVFNSTHTQDKEWASIGVVIGATVDWNAFDLPEKIEPIAPILAPGFGHQGAELTDLEALFGVHSPAVLVSESRGILQAGPAGVAMAIDKRRALLQEFPSA
ncbi:orotidine-5'-phosphate decarboxylase [Microbacterium sp. R86528]|uniref:orotidine-5'-phosphate decarboxylase n=1 Tax=Microbacterium sp. R86528 TaxID=3093864 RepID=UPI0037CA3092